MAHLVYNEYKKNIGNGTIDWDDNTTTTIKILLVTSAYVPDDTNHTFRSDITGEVVGTGYVAGGVAMTSRTSARDDINNKGVYDALDTKFPSVTVTARGAVIYKDTGNPATDPLICYIDFLADKSSAGGDFDIIWSDNGVFTTG